MAKPYFATAYYWLKHYKIGAKGGDIYSLVQKKFPQEEYGWSLNPGHYIAYDEWVTSPIFPNSTVLFESGTYMQLDLIPGPKPPYYGANIEDGYVLADRALQDELRTQYPKVYERIVRRKDFMQNVLGFEIGDEVLPMSEIGGYYRPYLLDREKAFIVEQ